MVGAGSHAAVYLARLHGRLTAVKVGGACQQLGLVLLVLLVLLVALGGRGGSRAKAATAAATRPWLAVWVSAVRWAELILLLPTAGCCRCLSWSQGWILAASGWRSACCAAASTSALYRCWELRSRCSTAPSPCRCWPEGGLCFVSWFASLPGCACLILKGTAAAPCSASCRYGCPGLRCSAACWQSSRTQSDSVPFHAPCLPTEPAVAGSNGVHAWWQPASGAAAAWDAAGAALGSQVGGWTDRLADLSCAASLSGLSPRPPCPGL